MSWADKEEQREKGTLLSPPIALLGADPGPFSRNFEARGAGVVHNQEGGVWAVVL